jgi:Flp pilus assembly protein protease CpaA
VIAPLFVVLAIVSISDIRYRRIPNWAVLVVCGLSVPWIVVGLGPSIFSASAALLIAFGLTWPLYALGVLGAGDSKLLMSVSLLIGLQKLLAFFVIVALAGGLVAVASLLMEPTRALVLFHMRGKGGKQVPYGVAIAMATILVIAWPFTHLNLG